MGSIGGGTNLERAGRAPGEGGEGGHGGLGGFGGSGGLLVGGRDLPSQILGEQFSGVGQDWWDKSQAIGFVCVTRMAGRMVELGVTEAETQQQRTRLVVVAQSSPSSSPNTVTNPAPHPRCSNCCYLHTYILYLAARTTDNPPNLP